MNPKIHRLLELRPFRPFVLETIGGNRIYVERPDWFWEPPGTDPTECVIFDDGGYWILRYEDLTENIQVQDLRNLAP